MYAAIKIQNHTVSMHTAFRVTQRSAAPHVIELDDRCEACGFAPD